jgi:hypothetical protein
MTRTGSGCHTPSVTRSKAVGLPRRRDGDVGGTCPSRGISHGVNGSSRGTAHSGGFGCGCRGSVSAGQLFGEDSDGDAAIAGEVSPRGIRAVGRLRRLGLRLDTRREGHCRELRRGG